MNIDKNRKIRDAHRTFVYKTVGNVKKILTEHVEDLTSFREKLIALKSLLIEKLETTKSWMTLYWRPLNQGYWRKK